MPISIDDPAAWNSMLASRPSAHVLQTWEWGQFKSRHGWTPHYLAWGSAPRPRACALVLRRRLGRLPLSVIYVPKGPAMDWRDADTVAEVLSDLARLARRSAAVELKIDPDLPPDPEYARALAAQGYRPSSEQIQFRNTMEIDLGPAEDELLARMHQKTRYNIRLAQKRGVTVRPGASGDLELLYSMYDETARRDGFVIRPFEYYRDAWGSFLQAGLGRPLIAQVEGEPVAAVILFCFAARAYYFYGMSRALHREDMPNHLLQWEAMRWARAQGCAVYDLWGAPDQLVESDPMWGVYRFKQGFGGRFVEHLGAWDWAAWRPLYWLYTAAMPRVLDLMRRRHATAQDRSSPAGTP